MFKAIAKKMWYMYKSRSLTIYSEDPYSTHLPVLVGIINLYGVKTVLEFGSGYNSTLSLLDSGSFPTLQKLNSVENYYDWYCTIQSKIPDSEKVEYAYHVGEMADAVSKYAIDQYDLVFVDDSITAESRANTLNEVLKRKPNIVVIHDFENVEYQKVSKQYGPFYTFKSVLPNVGVIMKSLDIPTLQFINATIARNIKNIPATNTKAWFYLFAAGGANVSE